MASAVDERLVEMRAANAGAGPMGKTGIYGSDVADEANPAKREEVLRMERDSEAAERFDAIGHQALTAGFVDGRLRRIRHSHGKAAGAESDGGSQTRGATAYDKDAGLFGLI
jgi:hypothetical protein